MGTGDDVVVIECAVVLRLFANAKFNDNSAKEGVYVDAVAGRQW